MQIEEGNQPAVMSESVDSGESRKSKAHGGRRPGAGRKPNLGKRLISAATADTFADIIATIDIGAAVRDIMRNGSRSVKAQLVKDIWDRQYGKPKQDVNLSGGLVVTPARDPMLALLPPEGLNELAQRYDEALQAVLKRYATPAIDVAQDGHGFQMESSIAIEAEVMESDHISA